jgi:hypothetical protein
MPSFWAASQTSRSFFPVSSPAWISGHIHWTQPVEVRGFWVGNDWRWTISDFFFSRFGGGDAAVLANNSPSYKQGGEDGQTEQEICPGNKLQQPTGAAKVEGRLQQVATAKVWKTAQNRVEEHKGVERRWQFFG